MFQSAQLVEQAHSGIFIIIDALVHIPNNAEEQGADGKDDAENLRGGKQSVLTLIKPG